MPSCEEALVICELCGQEFKRITRSHLSRRHGVAAEDYFRGRDRERFEKVAVPYSQGLSAQEVADATGLTRTTVMRVLRRRNAMRTPSAAQALAWQKHKTSREATRVSALHSAEARRKRLDSISNSVAFRDGCRKRQLRLWQERGYRQQMLHRIGRKTPNAAEVSLGHLLDRNGLPYTFVGDRSFLVGELNPDFVHANGERKLIELFGEYWHDPNREDLPALKTERGRCEYYQEHGYLPLIVWYRDLLHDPGGVLARIKEFDQL